MDGCDRIGALLGRVSMTARARFRDETQRLASELTATTGITLVVTKGNFVYGSSGYVSEIIPLLEKALEAKGYLPRRESSIWKDVWHNAPFQARLDVTEYQEGTYPSSRNRLTLIHAEVTLSRGAKQVWHATPRARSTVPLPNLPAHLANQVTAFPDRSDEFERLLYKNARDQIDQIFQKSLANMPRCPSLPGPKGS